MTTSPLVPGSDSGERDTSSGSSSREPSPTTQLSSTGVSILKPRTKHGKQRHAKRRRLGLSEEGTSDGESMSPSGSVGSSDDAQGSTTSSSCSSLAVSPGSPSTGTEGMFPDSVECHVQVVHRSGEEMKENSGAARAVYVTPLKRGGDDSNSVPGKPAAPAFDLRAATPNTMHVLTALTYLKTGVLASSLQQQSPEERDMASSPSTLRPMAGPTHVPDGSHTGMVTVR